MMGTQGASLQGLSRLSELCQGPVGGGAVELGANGAFAEAMEDQLGSLLTQLGSDPEQLEGLDLESLVAELKQVLHGQSDDVVGKNLSLARDLPLAKDTRLVKDLPLTAEQSAVTDVPRTIESLGGDALLKAHDLPPLDELLSQNGLLLKDVSVRDGGESADAGNSLTALQLFLEASGVGKDKRRLDAEADSDAELKLLLHEQSDDVVGKNLSLARDLPLAKDTRLVKDLPLTAEQSVVDDVPRTIDSLGVDALLKAHDLPPLDELLSQSGLLLKDVSVRDRGESADAGNSLTALKLFLEAGGVDKDKLRLDADADIEIDDETRAALAALLQQWINQDPSARSENFGLHRDPAVAAHPGFELLNQLRDVLGSQAGEDAEEPSQQSGRAWSDLFAQLTSKASSTLDNNAAVANLAEGEATTIGADALALMKASVIAGRGEPQNGAALESGRSFDLSRLLTPDGARQLADQMAHIARARDGVAELKLHPPSLGSMEVRVAIDGDKAHVHFVSPNPVVREVLDAAMPRLREALAQDGLALGDASVSDQPPQRREQAGENGGGSDESGAGTESEMETVAAESDNRHSTLSALARKLDLFA